ncbi:MAG: carbohydrate binding domain-containing protein [Candidatus Omnitrophota bacterium]|jgi:hypothetical protein
MLRIFLVALIIAITVPLYAAETPLVGRNLLRNESFENRPGFKDETPLDWGSWNSDYNGISTTESRRGQQSVYINCPKQNDSTGIFFTNKKVKPGNRYKFTAHFLNYAPDPVSGNAFGQLHIEWRKTTKDKDNKDVVTELGRDYGPMFESGTPTMKWTAITMSAIAPVDADNCNFVVEFLNKENGSGRFYVDDVSAEEISKGMGVKRYILSESRPGAKAARPAERGGTEKTRTEEGAGQDEETGLSLMAADFNFGDMGPGGVWSKDPNDNTQGCTTAINSQVKHGDAGFSLQIDYDVDSPNPAMIGVWLKLQDLNLSQYGKLSLWVKGDGSTGFSKNIKLELKNSKGETGKYTLSGITKDWKRFAIPMKEFSDITNFSSVTEFVIRFDDAVNADKKSGRIYVDDLSFVR